MAVGIQISRTAIDRAVGNLAIDARNWSQRVTQLVVGAGSLTDQQLIDTYGYTQSEVNTLRAAVAPMITAKNTLVTGKSALDAVTGID